MSDLVSLARRTRAAIAFCIERTGMAALRPEQNTGASRGAVGSCSSS
jgi:hypothetical protein